MVTQQIGKTIVVWIRVFKESKLGFEEKPWILDFYGFLDFKAPIWTLKQSELTPFTFITWEIQLQFHKKYYTTFFMRGYNSFKLWKRGSLNASYILPSALETTSEPQKCRRLHLRKCKVMYFWRKVWKSKSSKLNFIYKMRLNGAN